MVHLDLSLVPLVAIEAWHRFILHADCVDLLKRILIMSSKVQPRSILLWAYSVSGTLKL